MSQTQTQNLKAGPISVRKTNQQVQVPEWAQGDRLWPAFLAALLFIVFALAFVWTNHQSMQVGYAITHLHKERADLIDLNRKYKIELANLTSLDRLEHIARTELGLVYPGANQVQVIE